MGSTKKFLQLIMALCAATAVNASLFAQSITINDAKREALPGGAAEVGLADKGILLLRLSDEHVSHQKQPDVHATHR